MVPVMKELRCGGCNKKLGGDLEGRVTIVCPRSKCKRYNVFDSQKALDKPLHSVLK